MAKSEPHTYSPFNYKVFDKKVQDVLYNRTRLDNTVQVAMPFVKATTTIQREDYLGPGNLGFTLGTHAIPQDVKYQDIYSPTSEYPLVGYTYTKENTNELIYAKPYLGNDANIAKVNRYLSQGRDLFTNLKSTLIPPPGITQLKVGRNRQGMVLLADIEIVIPTLAQLEVLSRTFLIPNVGMILEWGQLFADDNDTVLDMFPWYDPKKRDPLFQRLASRNFSIKEVIDNFVLPNNCQYMWIFGRLSNYSLKGNTDGSFNCTIKVTGPSEDAFAYSVRNTMIAGKSKTGTFCVSDKNDIYSYFAETTAGGLNFKTLLDKVLNATEEPWSSWKDHVIHLEDQSSMAVVQPERASEQLNQGDPIVTEQRILDPEDRGERKEAYYLTWRFFVNVVVNDPVYGLRKIFKNVMDDQTYKKISLLRPYFPKDTPATEANIHAAAKDIYIADPYESHVGMNKQFRTVDLSTMFVVNEFAASRADPTSNNYDDQRRGIEGDLGSNPDKLKLASRGDFTLSTSAVQQPKDDAGFLSAGVWINHHAIVQAMTSAPTFLEGVSNLLQQINVASAGFWKLTLDAVEPQPGDKEFFDVHSYMVIDGNYRENSQTAVTRALSSNDDRSKIYTFNQFARISGNQLVGSELLECSIDLGMPKLLFSQISTLGLVQSEDLREENIGDKTDQSTTPLLSVANDTFRKMFASTSIFPAGPDKKSFDLTYGFHGERNNGTCSGQPTTISAGQAGSGRDTQSDPPRTAPNQQSQELATRQEEEEAFVNSAQCVACRKNCGVPGEEPIPERPNVGQCLGTSGLNPPRTRAVGPRRGAITTIVLHATVGPTAARESGDRQELDNLIRGLDSRTAASGYLGYHIIIHRSGKTTLLGDYTQRVNHASEYNNRAIGISFINGDNPQTRTREELTPQQVATAKTLVRCLATRFPSISRIVRHSQIAAKGDPGRLSDADLNEMKQAIASINNERSVATVPPPNAKRNGLVCINPPRFVGHTTPAPLPVVDTIEPGTAPEQQESVRGNQFRLSKKTSRNICRRCDDAYENIQERIARMRSSNSQEGTEAQSQLEQFLERNRYLQALFRYLEVAPNYMVSLVRGEANGSKSNSFGAAPGSLSISADLTMPGIAGIRAGSLFWLDRMPQFYKVFGAFQVMGIEDIITKDGWTTKIHSVFNYLGDDWKRKSYELLSTALKQ